MLMTQPMGTLAWPRRAAIIGVGTMGLGVAESWMAAGVPLSISDASQEQTQQAEQRLLERVRGHSAAGLVDPAIVDRVTTIELAGDIAAAVRQADLVFEAVF